MSLFAVTSVLAFAVSGSAATLNAVDLSGNPVQLFKNSSSKTTVLIFVRSDCPISNRYAPEFQRLYRKYSPGIAFYLVYADPSENVTAINKNVSEYGYTLGILRDPKHSLAQLAKARVTPEAAVFSPRGQLLYHGRIDDRYIDFGKSTAGPTKRDLEEALQSILEGKPVEVASTRAIGCFLADVQ